MALSQQRRRKEPRSIWGLSRGERGRGGEVGLEAGERYEREGAENPGERLFLKKKKKRRAEDDVTSFKGVKGFETFAQMEF